MLEAIVGVALRAILASVLLGGVLSALVLLATRALALTAATRHALWTTALIATGVMPIAGVGVSVARAYAQPVPIAQPEVLSPSRPAQHATSQVWRVVGASHDSARAANEPARAAHEPVRTADAANAVNAASTRNKPSAIAFLSSFADRFAFAEWTPRLTRELARGVVAVWALGALIGLFGLAASIVRVRGLKRRSSPLDGTLADELPWLTAANAGREIYLRLSYETETPVAIGFRRPVILIPTELATADGLAAIESLILHEHAHLRRYDDWTNLVQRAIERIFWFNPVVWLVGRRIALEREIASDDAVVEKTGEAHAYATSLWKLAREMRMPEHAVVAPGALLTRKQITVRIEQLLDKKRARLHRSPATALGVALAGVLAVAFVATSAPAVELPAAAAAAAPVASDKTAPAQQHHMATVPAQQHGTAAAPAKDRAAASLAAKPQAPKTTANETNAHARPMVRSDVAANVKPVVRERIVYVHDKNPQAKAPSSQLVARSASGETIAASSASSNSSAAGSAVAAPPAPERVPLPPLPPGATGTMPPMPSAAATLPPRAVAALRNATATAAAHAAKAAREATGTIGPDVERAIHDAMAALPRQIAQEAGTVPRPARYDGVKVTRELIAACTGCSFRNRDLRGIDLRNVRISGDDFSGADLRGANLSGAQLNGVSLARANLANADLRNAGLNGVELAHANFEGALLDGVRLTGVSMQTVSLRGTALRSIIASCTGCDFSRMDLHGQDLHGISLSGADLSHANLQDANLSGVRFSGVDLTHANLAGADLTNARLDGCDLTGVNLRGARITGMTMSGSGLDG